MMNYNKVLFSLLALLLFAACDPEIGPGIDFGNVACSAEPEIVETLTIVPSADPKSVFMMEFTGGSCPNCPKGAAAIEEILINHSNTFVPVAMHSTLGGIFSAVEGASQDFTLAEGTTYFTQFQGLAIPSASTDFFKFPEFQGAIMDPTQVSETGWIDYYNQRVGLSSPLNLAVSGANVDGSLEVSAEAIYHQTVEEDHFITVFVLESHIIDKQKMPDGSTNNDYEHNHIVRQLLTTTSGSILIGPDSTKEPGTKVTRNFCVPDIPDNWVLENLEFVAIVHKGGASLEVLQAAKSKI